VKPRPTAHPAGWLGALPAAVALCLVTGCDPTLSIQGSYFPAWIVCMAVAAVVTAVLRQLFVSVRIEPHLGPVLLIYPSLWVLMTMLTWLVFYRT
jgi:hypothetical protein